MMNLNPFRTQKRPQKRGQEGAPEWLVTYGDLQTLLFVFFISLITLTDPIDEVLLGFFSRPRESLIESELFEVKRTFKEAQTTLDGNQAQDRTSVRNVYNTDTTSRKEEKWINAIDSQLKGLSLARSEYLFINTQSRGIVISLVGNILFDKGSVKVKLDKDPYLLRDLSVLLNHESLKNSRVYVEGYADEVEVDPLANYRSNWELGALRAINVLQILSSYGIKEKNYSIASYGDVFLLESPQTDFSFGNKRVDIVIERSIVDL